MNNKISITDFQFKFSGYGHYKVTYTSPKTHKEYRATINFMPIIDLTKNAEEPKVKDLVELKRTIKALSI